MASRGVTGVDWDPSTQTTQIDYISSDRDLLILSILNFIITGLFRFMIFDRLLLMGSLNQKRSGNHFCLSTWTPKNDRDLATE